MFRTAEELNSDLLEVQEIWQEKCYTPLLEEYQNKENMKGRLSCAFSFGVSKHYVNSQKRIMIVGQEANDHTFDYKNWGLKSWQDWAVDYLDFQVYNENLHNRNFETNNSPFWQFFIELKKSGYGVCWNNLDKVRKYIKVDDKDWKESYLPYNKTNNSERQGLNEKIFDGNRKSLLQKEIELAKPDIVIFAVGPSNPYYHTLYSTLLDGKCTYDEILNTMKCPYPTAKKEYSKINDYIKNLKMPLYYTYHPNYLKQSRKFENVIKQILGNKN